MWNRARLGIQGPAAQGLHEEAVVLRDEQFRHDLRQPLTTAALLLDQVVDLPCLERATTARIRETQRQVRWALDLLRSQEEAATADLLDLGETISGVVDPEGSRCEVRLSYQPRCYVVARPVEVVRAARNLLDNAIHAATCSDGPQLVEVSVRSDRGLAVLAVDDSGPGFGHVPVRHGLGLASVREFARRSGGSVTVGTSRWGGASVALCLPAAAHRMAG